MCKYKRAKVFKSNMGNTKSSIKSNRNMNLEQKSILDLPDEVIDEIMAYLSYNDLYKLRNVGSRLGDCAKEALKNRAFSKHVINHTRVL